MNRLKIMAFFFLFFVSPLYAENFEKIFYLTPQHKHGIFDDRQLQTIKDQAQFIDVLAPHLYQLDRFGKLSGNLDPQLLDIAKKHHIKIMPTVRNLNFSYEEAAYFLHNPAAQETAIHALLEQCQRYHLDGIQIDFEQIKAYEKGALTHFVQLASDQLHKQGFHLSIAVIPHTSTTFNNSYDRWFFETWSGEYDYAALGRLTDFITLMSYSQHNSLTTPGPIAAADWVEKTIQVIQQSVPASKISLGVPSYSGHWLTGELRHAHLPEPYTYRSREEAIGYKKVLSLIEKFKLSLTWHRQWKSFYAIFTHNEKNEYLFVEDCHAFQEKIKLAKRYHLRGISVWKLGLEDPRIFNPSGCNRLER